MTPDASYRLATRILWGLVAGVVAGALVQGVGRWWPDILSPCRTLAEAVLDPLGQVFLRLLFLVVVPLVFASLALGIVQLGTLRKLGPLALHTGILFLLNMVIGVTLGLLAINLLRPGDAIDPTTQKQLMADFGGQVQQALALQQSQQEMTVMSWVEMLIRQSMSGRMWWLRPSWTRG
jgi:Na+/H+-dicarboxylate symporter